MSGQATALAIGGRAWSREEIDLVKQTVVPQSATDAEFKLLLYQSARLGLDPLSRQIYLVKRYAGGKEVCTLQTGIDGYRAVADRTGRYGGQEGPFWCGDDGEWRDVWTGKEAPGAAKVGVVRTDFAKPIYAVARWDEYVQTNREGKPTAMWAKMGALMLAKCAEALALRKAFPQDLSGVYTAEEMSQADSESIPTVETTARAGNGGAEKPSVYLAAALEHAHLKAPGVAPEQLADAFKVRFGHDTARATLEEAKAFALTAAQAPEGADFLSAMYGTLPDEQVS